MSESIGNTEQLAEPVACRYDFDGYGYLYMDAGSGSDWASRVKDCEPLYTHPMRELSDEEMLEVYKKVFNKQNEFKENLKRRSYFDFARAILKKASRGEK